MKRVLAFGVALCSLAMTAAWAGQYEDFDEAAYMAQQQEMQRQLQPDTPVACQPRPVAVCDEPPAPKGMFVVIPQYFHSRNSKTTINFDGTRLHLGKSQANGAGATFLFNKRVGDFLNIGFMYEYGFLKLSGAPIDPTGFTGTTDQRYHSHVVGVLPEFNFEEFGKLQLSVIQGFDRSSGNSVLSDGTRVSHEKDGSNVTSLMAWYEKDFALGENWKLTPYVGWRSLYVVVKSANPDNNMWVHLASGGLKLAYQSGKFGFNLRGGVSYRTTKADVPAYGNRAVAPGVVQFSHRANLDRTLGSAGLGVSYAISPRAIMALGYDGTWGSDTSSHMGSLTFVFPF